MDNYKKKTPSLGTRYNEVNEAWRVRLIQNYNFFKSTQIFYVLNSNKILK